MANRFRLPTAGLPKVMALLAFASGACSGADDHPNAGGAAGGGAGTAGTAGTSTTMGGTSGGGSSGSAAGGSGNGGLGTGGSGPGGAGAAGSSASGTGGSGGAPSGAPGVHFVGRVDASDPANARFAWSGTGVVARFSGSSVAARLGGGQQYTVLIDGELQPKVVPSGMSSLLAENLPDGPHVVEIYRRTEVNQGESVFSGFDFGGGELLAPPQAPERRIEIVGDSISCGYGNEGPDMNCGFTPDTENHYLSYGAIAARSLGAELSTVAWSGKGVACNYGDDATSCMEPMPVYYERILPSRPDSAWDFAAWQPDAVVINLGTNDFSTMVDPTPEEFEGAYVALLERIRAANPDAVILCTLGPGSGAEHTTAVGYIANAVQARAMAGDSRVTTFALPPTNAADGYGCDWHPSLLTHERMAEALTAALRAELGW